MTEEVPPKGLGADAASEEGRRPGVAMDIHEVLEYLPHRYPFLLIDRVLSYTPGESLTALKNVTFNEHFFTGHFPRRPVMPGVLIIEALAQATGVLAYKTAGTTPASGPTNYLAAIDNARFKQPVEPGDQLIFEVRLTRAVRGIWNFSGEVKVDGRGVASADLMCARRDIVVCSTRARSSTPRPSWRRMSTAGRSPSSALMWSLAPVPGKGRMSSSTVRRASAATIKFSSSRRSARCRRTRNTVANPLCSRSATATSSANSAPSIAAPNRAAASPGSATTIGSWRTCTSRTIAWSATTPSSPIMPRWPAMW